MKHVLLALLLPFLHACEHHTLPLQPDLSTPQPSKSVKGNPVLGRRIIIAGGQSNNAGLGMATEFQPFPGVTIDNLRKGPTYAMASDLESRLGPITIYQCSISGSSMESWSTYGDLYIGCETYVRSQLKAGDQVIAFTFDQGESEAGLTTPYPWAQHFTAMVNDLRTHFPNVPVIYVQLGAHTTNPPDVPNWQYIQDQQSSINLSKTSMVTTGDLDVVGEHYTQGGYEILGQRMAQAYLGIQ